MMVRPRQLDSITLDSKTGAAKELKTQANGAAQQGLAIERGFEDAFVEVDGARVHYVHAGSGRPLLLVHGLTGSTSNWREQVSRRLPIRCCLGRPVERSESRSLA